MITRDITPARPVLAASISVRKNYTLSVCRWHLRFKPSFHPILQRPVESLHLLDPRIAENYSCHHHDIIPARPVLAASISVRKQLRAVSVPVADRPLSAVNSWVLTIRSPHHTYRSVFCHLRCMGTRDSTVEITNNSIGRQFLGGSPGVAPKSAGGLSLQTRHFLVPDRIMVTLKALRGGPGAGHN